jgi:5-methyltetrahydrofolate--homocysteine methyltransferase
MIIIGEKINATRKSIGAALAERNAELIARVAREQADAGADYIDVNGGDPDPRRELDNVVWLVEVVRAACDKGVCVDSADPAAAAAGLAKAGPGAVLNSISLEKARTDAMLPVVAGHACMVVGLLMSDDGPPASADDRLARAEAMVEMLAAVGKDVGQIIIDPCFFPLAADAAAVAQAIAGIRAIRENWPGIHIGGGVSNTSHGLPQRRFVNLAAMVAAMVAGMDCPIIDPCVPGTMGLARAAEALAGRDEFCMNYVNAARAGRLT